MQVYRLGGRGTGRGSRPARSDTPTFPFILNGNVGMDVEEARSAGAGPGPRGTGCAPGCAPGRMCDPGRHGARPPTLFVVTVATLGALAVTYLFDVAMLGAIIAGDRPDGGLVQGPHLMIMGACYAPIMLWGVFVLATTAGYWRRRTTTTDFPVE